MWKTTQILTNNNKQTPPRIITHQGNIVTSIKRICNIANKHYIEKISKIRNNFHIGSQVSPIEILSKLINKNNNSIEIRYATIDDISNIV